MPFYGSIDDIPQTIDRGTMQLTLCNEAMITLNIAPISSTPEELLR
jgi:hypothetical protein